MKPKDFIAQNGIAFFQAQKGKTITVRLLSDAGLVFTGYFVGITPANNAIPIVDGYLIDLPQFTLKMMIKVGDSGNESLAVIKVNLLMIDSMDDIVFSDNE